jgi:quercetin dioxygenase-like cupin family protein
MEPIEIARAHPVEPQVMRPADPVACRDGSVVSRQMLEKDAGNMTAFRFAAGQARSEHAAPFDALVRIPDGEAPAVIEGEPCRLAAGDSIVMPADRPHAVEAVTPFKMVPTMGRSPA